MSLNYDVIIAGCGAAGLYAAINLPSDAKILMVCKKELSLCNSSLAQGGIAGVYNSPKDNIQYHQNDTLIAGGFKNNVDAVHTLVSEAAQDIEHIIDLGVEFNKNPDGTYHRTLEGGHSHHRIFHHADATGKEIATKLLAKVQTLENVDIMENTLMCAVKQNSTGYSAFLRKPDGTYETVNSRFMILATGGIGRVYKYTTNSAIATGDGIAFAYMLGARIKNLSRIQFHPTAFAADHGRERFLISEAVRGEGAVLLNCNGERFASNYDSRGELAPRDVVSNAVMLESIKTNSENFYLDITHKPADFVRNRFPMIYERCLEEGVDITKDRIPVFPCQHYLMGGIDVDLHSRTTVEGLYAAGECSHTGVHGANRLASNSLLEALVYSRTAALDITDKINKFGRRTLGEEPVYRPVEGKTMPHGCRSRIREILQDAYFVLPKPEKYEESSKQVHEIMSELFAEKYEINSDLVEARSAAIVASIIFDEIMEGTD